MALLRALAQSVVAIGGAVALATPAPDPAALAMAVAARAFLETMPPALQAKAKRPFDDPERTRWNFVPGDYAGVAVKELDDAQRAAARALGLAALSARGFEKTAAIVQLELVLRQLESTPARAATHRDPGRYALLVFGEPKDDGTWGWRVQGHHVSLRFTVVGGRFAGGTPAFLGSNPHELRQGDQAGTRILGAEEDLARALLLMCDDAQRAQVVIETVAPADIVLGPARAADFAGKPRGLAWAAMNEGQRALLWRLLTEYVHNLRPEFAQAELQRIKDRGLDGVHFAWCGGLERGQGHYYRIHGPHFVVEYDNTQDHANHVHTVWRDLERDFGADLLRQHLEQHQHEQRK